MKLSELALLLDVMLKDKSVGEDAEVVIGEVDLEKQDLRLIPVVQFCAVRETLPGKTPVGQAMILTGKSLELIKTLHQRQTQ